MSSALNVCNAINFTRDKALTTGCEVRTCTNEAQTFAPGLDSKSKRGGGASDMDLRKHAVHADVRYILYYYYSDGTHLYCRYLKVRSLYMYITLNDFEPFERLG